MIGILSLFGALSAPAEAACVVITGAAVGLPDGPATGPTVVVVDDRIAAVAERVPGLEVADAAARYRGQDCALVPAEGQPLTPGLVAVPTHLGLVEVDLEVGSRSHDPEIDDPVRAAMVVADGYDPLSVLLPVQRIHGITSTVTVPSGGFVSGMGAWAVLRGTTQAEAVVDRDAVLAITLPTRSVAGGLRQVRELVADVRLHARSPGLYDQGRPYFPGASRLDLEALRPVVDGRIPVLVGADEASDLEALVRLKRELGLDLVVVGGAEGWLVAEALAEAEIPVIVDAFVYGPGGFDHAHARPDNAARLHEAGVRLIIGPGTGDTHNVRVLRQAAGNAVRDGLPHQAAVRAITETPAAVFGQPERGRIAPGAVADLVLWSGDPLELSTAVKRMWIGGVEVPLTSRQTELLEKYRTLPGSPVPALPPSR